MADTPTSFRGARVDTSNPAVQRALGGDAMERAFILDHGVENLVFTGATPWHQFGILKENGLTIDDLLSEVFFWEAILEEMITASGIKVDGHKAVVRSDTQETLGVVGTRYDLFQPKEYVEYFRPFVEAGFKLETAGTLDKGSKLWILARPPGACEAEVRPGDKISQFVIFTGTLDGSMGKAVHATESRAVCRNTIRRANRDFAGRRIKSTKNQRTKIAYHVDNQVKALTKDFEANLETYKSLAEKQVNPGAYFEAFARSTMADPTEKDLSPQAESKIVDLFELLESTPREDRRSDTLWDAFNAVSAYQTHERAKTRDAETRAESLYFGEAGKQLDVALKIAIEMRDGTYEYVTGSEASTMGLDPAQIARAAGGLDAFL